jgi:hypothetical protein
MRIRISSSRPVLREGSLDVPIAQSNDKLKRCCRVLGLVSILQYRIFNSLSLTSFPHGAVISSEAEGFCILGHLVMLPPICRYVCTHTCVRMYSKPDRRIAKPRLNFCSSIRILG